MVALLALVPVSQARTKRCDAKESQQDSHRPALAINLQRTQEYNWQTNKNEVGNDRHAELVFGKRLGNPMRDFGDAKLAVWPIGQKTPADPAWKRHPNPELAARSKIKPANRVHQAIQGREQGKTRARETPASDSFIMCGHIGGQDRHSVTDHHA